MAPLTVSSCHMDIAFAMGGSASAQGRHLPHRDVEDERPEVRRTGRETPFRAEHIKNQLLGKRLPHPTNRIFIAQLKQTPNRILRVLLRVKRREVCIPK